MLRYFIIRTASAIVTLWVVSVMVFILIELPPSDYAERYAYRKIATAGQEVTPEVMDELRKQFGLDQPVPVRYVKWISDIILPCPKEGSGFIDYIKPCFYFGESFVFNVPVTSQLGDTLGNTLLVSVSALILTYLIAIPFGVYSALNRHTPGDYVITMLGYIGLALPNYIFALIMLYFSVTIFNSSAGGLYSPEFVGEPMSLAKFWDLLNHLWVPALVLGTANTAFQIQTMRASMLDEINKLYVDAARARGIPEWKVIFKYPFRIALNPIISYLPFDLARVVSGAAIVAFILQLPTSGALLLEAFKQQDVFLGGAILMWASLLVIIGTFLSDILLGIMDPRIRLGA